MSQSCDQDRAFTASRPPSPSPRQRRRQVLRLGAAGLGHVRAAAALAADLLATKLTNSPALTLAVWSAVTPAIRLTLPSATAAASTIAAS